MNCPFCSSLRKVWKQKGGKDWESHLISTMNFNQSTSVFTETIYYWFQWPYYFINHSIYCSTSFKVDRLSNRHNTDGNKYCTKWYWIASVLCLDWLIISRTASPRRQAKERLNTFPLPVRLGVQLLTLIKSVLHFYMCTIVKWSKSTNFTSDPNNFIEHQFNNIR